jgi:hypothetical protein
MANAFGQAHAKQWHARVLGGSLLCSVQGLRGLLQLAVGDEAANLLQFCRELIGGGGRARH